MENSQFNQNFYANDTQYDAYYNDYTNYYQSYYNYNTDTDTAISTVTPKPPSFYQFNQNSTPIVDQNYYQYMSPSVGSFNYYTNQSYQDYSTTSPSPASNCYNYYNSYNSSHYSTTTTPTTNDSGYQNSSLLNNSLPNGSSQISSPRLKLDYTTEINQELENEQPRSISKKRKNRDEHQEQENVTTTDTKDDSKCDNKKRPKLLKLQNLESSDVELKCENCPSVFYSAAKLIIHQFIHHKNGNSKQCPICFRKFGSYSNTMVHLRGHTQEKIYQCKQCDKSFVDVSTLKKHQRIHSGEKPYECHFCFKKFSQSGNLSRHLLTHQDENECDQTTTQPLSNKNKIDYFNSEIVSNGNVLTNAYQNGFEVPSNYQFTYYQNYNMNSDGF